MSSRLPTRALSRSVSSSIVSEELVPRPPASTRRPSCSRLVDRRLDRRERRAQVVRDGRQDRRAQVARGGEGSALGRLRRELARAASDDVISRANASRIAVVGLRLDGRPTSDEHMVVVELDLARLRGLRRRGRRPRGRRVQPASVRCEHGDGVESEKSAEAVEERRATVAPRPPSRRAPRPRRGLARRRAARRAASDDEAADDGGDGEEDRRARAGSRPARS